jgi:hypothetical protein
MGIETRFVKGDDPTDFEKLIDDKTKVCSANSGRMHAFIPMGFYSPSRVLRFTSRV